MSTKNDIIAGTHTSSVPGQRAMNHAADPHAATWTEAIKTGDDQLDRGERIAYMPDLLQEITASALTAMHSGTALDLAVLP